MTKFQTLQVTAFGCREKIEPRTESGIPQGLIIIIIIDQHSDKCCSTTDFECHAAGSREGTEIQQFTRMYRDTTNVESEM